MEKEYKDILGQTMHFAFYESEYTEAVRCVPFYVVEKKFLFFKYKRTRRYTDMTSSGFIHEAFSVRSFKRFTDENCEKIKEEMKKECHYIANEYLRKTLKRVEGKVAFRNSMKS